MSNQTLSMTEDLYRYVLQVSLRESPVQQRLREETARLAEHNMQISPEQGQFMALLVRLLQAKNIVEVGTFTGYSALCMAQPLPEDGSIVCCDVNENWAQVAQRYWVQAGVEHKIKMRLAPATKTLQALIDEGQAGLFDMAFIDADKINYPAYFELCLRLVRKNGLIVIDNTLWAGAVIDDADCSDDTQAIRAFNQSLYQDTRVDISLLPISDGLSLALKR